MNETIGQGDARQTPRRVTQLLHEVEQRVAQGMTVPDACSELGITKPTYYRWRRNAERPSSVEASSSATAQHILDVAEQLCAERGLGVSLREIAREAEVSNGTLSYHFESRTRLIREICARRVDELDTERYELLDRAESESHPPKLEDVIVAFFLPGLRATASSDPGMASYMRFLGRLALDPAVEMQSIMERCYSNLHKRFMFAFSRALPDQSLEEVYWRYTAFTGVFVTMAQNPNRIGRISAGQVSMANPEVAMERLLAILVPMMRGEPEPLS